MHRLAAIAFIIAMAAGGAMAGERALLIGIDSYADSRLNAKMGTPAVNDVTAIRSLLMAKFGYAARDIRVLTNGAATAAAIRDGLANWLIAGSRAGDRVYLYFAGNGYFAPDLNGDEADGLDEGLVPFDARASEEGGKLAIDGLVSDDEIGATLQEARGPAGHAGVRCRFFRPRHPHAHQCGAKRLLPRAGDCAGFARHRRGGQGGGAEAGGWLARRAPRRS